MDETVLHDLGKVELHCHLDGSLSLPMIRRLAKRIDLPLPPDDEELRTLVQAPANAATLMDYLKPFDVIRPLLQDEEALALAAYDVAAQAAGENVRYIEIRFAPELSMDQGLTVAQTINGVVRGLHQAMNDYDIVAKALVCGMRQGATATNAAMFTQAASQLGEGLVGGDFAGNEHDFPTAAIAKSIQFAQRQGVPLTFHAGEDHCPQNIAAALSLGITRIGHATAIVDQPQLIRQFVQQGATAELCLSSNLQTKAARTLAEFPYRQLIAAGAKVTINTDNRTVSNTTLTREYQRFADSFGTTVNDFLAFNQNAVDAAFLPAADKQPLYQRLLSDYEPYL